jgi:hypothetical protein
MMKLANRVLPSPVGVEGDEAIPGLEAREMSYLPDWLARIGESASAKHNEI